jgi:hypothetical protein
MADSFLLLAGLVASDVINFTNGHGEVFADDCSCFGDSIEVSADTERRVQVLLEA